MIQITQLKLPVTHTREQLEHKIRKMLRLDGQQKCTWKITRRGIDARDQKNICYVYTVSCTVDGESKILRSNRHNNIMLTQEHLYREPEPGSLPLSYRPVIIGSGPAGLFCAYKLAKAGYRPILLQVPERNLEFFTYPVKSTVCNRVLRTVSHPGTFKKNNPAVFPFSEV